MTIVTSEVRSTILATSSGSTFSNKSLLLGLGGPCSWSHGHLTYIIYTLRITWPALRCHVFTSSKYLLRSLQRHVYTCYKCVPKDFAYSAHYRIARLGQVDRKPDPMSSVMEQIILRKWRYISLHAGIFEGQNLLKILNDRLVASSCRQVTASAWGSTTPGKLLYGQR